jgi:hypothetical protein
VRRRATDDDSQQWRNDMTKTLKLSGKMKTIDIAKQIADHVAMLPGMIDKCHDHFIPQVLSLIGARRDSHHFQIEFIEAMPQVSGLRFEMQIDIEGMMGYDLRTMLLRMDALCMWEPGSDPETCGFSLNGYTFTMGDGDDAGAVYVRNGKLCVWVRAWKE